MKYFHKTVTPPPRTAFMKSLFRFCHWFWGIYYFWIRDIKSDWPPCPVCEIISKNSGIFWTMVSLMYAICEKMWSMWLRLFSSNYAASNGWIWHKTLSDWEKQENMGGGKISSSEGWLRKGWNEMLKRDYHSVDVARGQRSHVGSWGDHKSSFHIITAPERRLLDTNVMISISWSISLMSWFHIGLRNRKIQHYRITISTVLSKADRYLFTNSGWSAFFTAI